MESRVYKQDFRAGLLEKKVFYVRDYFKYYTTGIEDLITAFPDQFSLTTRRDAERPENIMVDLFDDPDLADVFVAINNQNYMWATPFDLDAFHDAITFRMNYIELLMRGRIEKQEIRDPETGKVIKTIYNDVGDACYKKASDSIHEIDDVSRKIVVPNKNSVSFVVKKIEEYLKIREVK